jgi:hypothetical protein
LSKAYLPGNGCRISPELPTKGEGFKEEGVLVMRRGLITQFLEAFVAEAGVSVNAQIPYLTSHS